MSLCSFFFFFCAGRLFETLTGGYAPFGPPPFLEWLFLNKKNDMNINKKNKKKDSLQEIWEVVDGNRTKKPTFFPSFLFVLHCP